MSKPTEKQLKFIEDICEVLDLHDPKPKTIEEASAFIDEYITEYRYAKRFRD